MRSRLGVSVFNRTILKSYEGEIFEHLGIEIILCCQLMISVYKTIILLEVLGGCET
jgi:hypothetical protein